MCTQFTHLGAFNVYAATEYYKTRFLSLPEVLVSICTLSFAFSHNMNAYCIQVSVRTCLVLYIHFHPFTLKKLATRSMRLRLRLAIA